MEIKRRLIELLPPEVKRLLAVPYDYIQTLQADREFQKRPKPSNKPSSESPQHIVCIVVDALRGDSIDEETTPYMASLTGTTEAVAPGSWTFPSVSSILTGQYPHEHGALHGSEGGSEEGMVLPSRMDEDKLSVSEVLTGAGYETYGGFGHDTPFVALSGRFGTHSLSHQVNSSAEDVLENHLEWLRDHSEQRTFSYVHLADPHIPVDPPEEYWEKYDVDSSIPNIRTWDYHQDREPDAEGQRYRKHRRRLYQASVEYVDDCLQEYADELNEISSESLLFVTSDHGESHWENVDTELDHFEGNGCVGHGGTPYEPLARVPLLTDGLEFESEYTSPVSLVDIVPTLLELVGIEDALSTSGVPLTKSIAEERPVFVEGNLSNIETKAVYRGTSKLIASSTSERVEFELPDETPVELPSETEQKLLAALPDWSKSSGEGTEVSEVVEDRLEKLGYK